MILILALVLALLFLPFPWNVAVIVAAALVEVTIALVGLRYARRRRAAVGIESLVGQTGEAITPLLPDGQVRLNGEIWHGHAGTAVGAGTRVRVTAVASLTLEVEPVR